MTQSEITTLLSGARVDLVEAQRALAIAERDLPGANADTTMATPAMMAILDKVRVARRLLQNIEKLAPSDVEGGTPPPPST